MGGTALFTLPAPAGTVLTITSSDPRVATVPSPVAVPAGSTSAPVWVMTHAVDVESTVTITATMGNLSHSGLLRVPPGSFLSYASPPGDPVAEGRSRRHTVDTSGFTAAIDATLNLLVIQAEPRASGVRAHLVLKAPAGQQLGVGFYGNAGAARQVPDTQAGLEFLVAGTCHLPAGSFHILEAVYGPGPTVERFHATFLQDCSGVGAALMGEVKIGR